MKVENVNIQKALQGYQGDFYQEVFTSFGYKFFIGQFDLNIFGIRNRSRNAGMFDDVIGVAFTDLKGRKLVRLYPATTDPSEKWLLKPLHPKGTIIVQEGQYRGVYKKGIHGRSWASGGYPALEQHGKFLYTRDNNKDSFLDFSFSVFEDNAKTNLHRASKWKIAERVGSFSAGCQVIQDPDDFDDLMTLVDLQIRHIGVNSFTYTLFNIDDILKWAYR